MTEEANGQNQVDPVIEKAASAGWKPLEEFAGDPEQWVDAKEFVSRAPLYEKNHKLKKRVADLESTLHEVKGHITKVSQAAYTKAVNDLMTQRDEAIEIGDKDQVKALDKEIKVIESAVVKQDNTHPAVKLWVAENPWFEADKKMKSFAISYQVSLFLDNPNITMEDSLKEVDEAVRKAFPDKFQIQHKQKEIPAVESGGKNTGKKTFTKSDLDDEARRTMNRFVRMGVMTEEEYIKELVDSDVIGGKK